MLHQHPIERRALREAVRTLREPFRPNYPAGPYLVDPMPATQHEIEGLRSILRYIESKRSASEPERMLSDALKRALAYLEEPDSRVNVMRFILGAIHASMRREGPNRWTPADMDLLDWGMTQIEAMLGPVPTDALPEKVVMRDSDPHPMFTNPKGRKP